MIKPKILKTKVSRTEQGFTMLEVLVAVLIATAFLAAALQATVLGTMVRVKAQEKQKASQWIQEDIETIKFEATDVTLKNNLRCSAASYSNGYANALIQKFKSSQSLDDTSPFSSLYLQDQGFLGYSLRLNRNFLGDGRIPGSDTTSNSADISQSNAPHKVLKIQYTVEAVKDNGATTIAEDYIEVMPNVALQCP